MQIGKFGASTRHLRVRLDKTAKAGTLITRRYCNIKCIWCHHDFFDHEDNASLGLQAISNEMFAEATQRVIDVSKAEDVQVRLAGDGDPTIVGTEELCDLVSRLRKIPQITKIKMTTNGILLSQEMATALAHCGLDSVTVSINSLNSRGYEKYAQTNRLNAALAGLAAASEAGLGTKVNAIYTSINSDEVDKYILLSQRFAGMPIKFFDLLVDDADESTKELYQPLENLETQLRVRGPVEVRESARWPYPSRIYRFQPTATIIVKISHDNNCPNLSCLVRDICLEGCRHSVRIGLDGIMRPCGVRSDNILNLFSTSATPDAIWKALNSGGKVGYALQVNNIE